MARKAIGYQLRSRGGWGYVRFTFAGKRYQEALGIPYDPKRSSAKEVRAAHDAAEKLYAETISGRIAQPTDRVFSACTLQELAASWLTAVETPNNARSIATKEIYTKHWFAFFADHPDEWPDDERTPLERLMSDAGPFKYSVHRLRKVLRTTVKKELTAMFEMLRWGKIHGHLGELPPRPELRLNEPGTRSGPQRASPVAITPEQARAIIDVLPEWSSEDGRGQRPFRVRDHFEFMWETGLRPSTISRLEVPRNYAHGAKGLVLFPQDDKARYGRPLPLTARARAVLERVAPREGGLIFGEHDYRVFLKLAALRVLPKGKARAFAAYDFRHGKALAWLDGGATLPGVAYLLGHKQMTTTNEYLEPTWRQAEAVLECADGAIVGPIMGQDARVSHDSPTFQSGRVDSNHRPLDPQPSGNSISSGNIENGEDEPPHRFDEKTIGSTRPVGPIAGRGVLTDLQRGLAIQTAVWDAFDLMQFGGEVDPEEP